MLVRKSWWIWLLALVLSGCSGAPAGPGSKPTPVPPRPQAAATKPAGLRFKLSAANSASDMATALPQAQATPLPSAEIDALVRRLPPLQSRPADRQAFALRPGSQPPPRTAKQIQQPFPPPDRPAGPPPVPPGEPLKITNIAPRGEVEMAPHLTVSFNQPMVPITTVESLAERDVPVKLTPQPPGKWRWLGTQTLMFVPQIRFPMATEYKVEIAAGVASANGVKLGVAQSQTFSTPPPQMTQSYPTGGPQILHPLIFVAFNQDVDPARVAARVKINDATLRPASPAEVVADDALHGLSEAAGKNRWAAFVPQQDLQPGHSYTVEVGAGLTSLEGPLPTKSPQTFSFSTYDPLAIQWKTDDTSPGEGWSVNFNNALESSKFNPAWVQISPPLPQLKVKAMGSTIAIRGRSKGQTSYRVTLAPELLDVYAQRLGHPESFTVKVGSAEPRFNVDASQFTVLDPKGPRQLTCKVVNYKKLKVEVWKVGLDDWEAYFKFLQQANQNPEHPAPPPGSQVIDTVIDTQAPLDEETEVTVDLSKAFPTSHGHCVVRIEPDPQPGRKPWQRQRFVGWLQSTELGVDAACDGRQLVAWVNDLASGQPVAGAEVSLWPGGDAGGSSNAQGLITMPLPANRRLLVVRKGDDMAILPRDFNYWSSNDYYRSEGSDTVLWHVLDDRKLYRPGEKVWLKGWVRLNQWGPTGDLVSSPMTELSYRLVDSVGNEVSKGKTRVGALGGFSFSLALPKTINLGNTRLELSGSGGSYVHSFQVEEFRRPEFEVNLQATPASSRVGSSTVLTATAAYFSGGPLANAKVQWTASSTPTTFSPPGWAEYTFGTWTPWWNYRCWWSEGRAIQDTSNATSFETKTDSKGKSGLKAEFLSVDPSQPHNLSVQATVQDVNRQSWSSNASVLVHPASVYVGLKSARTFVEKGQPLELSMVVTDLDGKAVAGRPVEVRAYRLDWEDFGEVKHADETTQTVTSARDPVVFKVPSGQGGTYQVEARVQDEENRSNSSQLTLWVAGGKQPPGRGVQQESVTLVPAKKEYSPGETAEVLVQAPFAPAELLVTTRRNGLAHVERLTAASGSTTLKIPIEDLHIPGLNVQVDAVGSKVRSDAEGDDLPGKPMRPAYATGSLTLTVSNATRKLSVEVTPAQAKLEPGGSTSVQVQVKDSTGKPVQGEVALIMVDESVLALTGYDPANPLDSFCILRSPDCWDVHLRQYLMLRQVQAEGDVVVSGSQRKTFRGEASAAPGSVPDMDYNSAVGSTAGGMLKEKAMDSPMPQGQPAPAARREPAASKTPAQPPPQLKVRTNFAALALFEPALKLDAQGRTSVKVKLPDSLTRYRLIALAASGIKQFGKGESSVTARQALMIRPSAPRFLNFGDKFQLPVMVQNQTDQAMQVSLVCRGGNAVVGAKDRAGFGVTVPANDRVEVRIPAAADQAGTARFQFGASAGKAGDAAEVSLPVWTPATTEAFATYGVIDTGAISQPVERPKNVWTQFGGLSVTTSSTALSELTDAFLYLASYPFECSEQVSSRMLAAAALQDVLAAFEAPGLASKEQLAVAMGRDLEKLRGQQNDDGGWDYWVRNEPSVPYLSVHVAHTLVRVQSKGYKVDERMLQQAMAFLANIEQHIPPEYGDECRRCIRAYALYVENLAGKPDFVKTRALAREVSLDRLGNETIAWLLPSLAKDPQSRGQVDEIYRYLDNHSTQTASTAQFSSGYSDQGYLVLYSDRRDDGLLLESMITTRPNHPLIPKLVRGLLDHRTAGRWENTQENCWVLLALDKYFHQYESVTPNFVARLWLGDRFAGEQQFRGRDKDEKQLDVPLSQVQGPLVIDKNGPGRLYYRVGLNYAPKDLKQAPADYGFAVQRLYEAVGDNRDVRRDADGVWHIKAGAEVKVTLTMQAPSRRYHVALVDPLPAGLEAVNPALLGAKSAPPNLNQDRSRGGWWSSYWYDHQNLRDERVEAFTQLLWEGVYTYSYVARATTPGNFVVPPTKAEEMYHPETFGRSGSDKVIVE